MRQRAILETLALNEVTALTECTLQQLLSFLLRDKLDRVYCPATAVDLQHIAVTVLDRYQFPLLVTKIDSVPFVVGDSR